MCAPTRSRSAKHLEAIFSTPPPKSLEWARIESLFVALGCIVIEGNGSRVRFELGGVVGTFHRPPPAKEAKPYQVKDAKLFLTEAGMKP
ncbi:MAG: pilus assembly protein HicB [Gallionellales bacterium RBG_16_56_9]|nr:MAG: pilus assembly protein HicB [Gallionellales bacterium RBG_16_56_9]